MEELLREKVAQDEIRGEKFSISQDLTGKKGNINFVVRP